MIDTAHFGRAGRHIPGIVVGTLRDGTTEFAGVGTLADRPSIGETAWEIGSITKVFTGVLLAEMSQRGVVRLDDPIGRHLPAEVAARLPEPGRQPTLTDLATHTSGLPGLPWRWLWRWRGSPDPYAALTERDVWNALGPKTRLPRRRKHHYSNFGMGLLGHLLGRAAGVPFERLVIDRIVSPLGMESTGIALPGVVQGLRKGRPTPPWTFGALAAAGALRSTPADMLRFATATIDPPPGPLGEALTLAREVAWRGRVLQMGLGWMRRIGRPGVESETVWHNGGTYGGSSFLAVDPVKRTAMVAFGNTGPRLTTPLDAPSWKVLDGLGADD